ncbi:hypothetical protein Chor_004532 [Crotalus horridus]
MWFFSHFLARSSAASLFKPASAPVGALQELTKSEEKPLLELATEEKESTNLKIKGLYLEVQIKISPSDLRIDTFRAKGAGGQHVNKTDSAVRVVHIPTGIVVECQQARSQLMNKETALQTLREKLYFQTVMKEINEQQSTRKLQLGTRSQSERIRTYNFNQDRVTDHRISYDVRDIKEFLNGKEHLDNLISSLLETSQMKLLAEQLENNLKSLSAGS